MRFEPKRILAGATLAAGLLMSALPASAARVAVGDTAPGFNLEATDHSMHQLEALRGEHSAVLVFFRGAW